MIVWSWVQGSILASLSHFVWEKFATPHTLFWGCSARSPGMWELCTSNVPLTSITRVTKASMLPRGVFSTSLITRSHTRLPDVEQSYVGLTVHWANSDVIRVNRLVTQSIAIPSLPCLPGQAPPSRELEPTVWSRMKCPPIRNFDTFSPALPVQLKLFISSTVMWKLNLDLTDEQFSLGGDCHPRTTSAHFPATIVIWKDAEQVQGVYSATFMVSTLPFSLPLQVNLSQFLLASPSN